MMKSEMKTSRAPYLLEFSRRIADPFHLPRYEVELIRSHKFVRGVSRALVILNHTAFNCQTEIVAICQMEGLPR